MVSIIDEIKEDLKEEQAYRIIKKYSSFVFAVMALVIIGVSLKLWWDSYNENKFFESGSKFLTAVIKLQAGNTEEGVKILEELSNSGDTNYAALASLQVAAHDLYSKKPDHAVEKYQAISQNKNYADELRQYAALMKIKAEMDKPEKDNNKLINEIKSYLKKNSVFNFTAWEMLGTLYIAANDATSAKEAFYNIITATEAPSTSQERAKQLLQILNS